MALMKEALSYNTSIHGVCSVLLCLPFNFLLFFKWSFLNCSHYQAYSFTVKEKVRQRDNWILYQFSSKSDIEWMTVTLSYQTLYALSSHSYIFQGPIGLAIQVFYELLRVSGSTCESNTPSFEVCRFWVIRKK